MFFFICIGLVKERETIQKNKMKKILPTVHSNRQHSAYETDALTIAQRNWFDGVELKR